MPKRFATSRHRDSAIMSHDQSILFGIIAYHGPFDSCLIADDCTLPCLAIFQEKSEFSCDSSRANDGSLIKPLRRPLMMIFRNVDSRDVFGIIKQLYTHNDKRKHLLQEKCTEHLMVCYHNYNAHFVRLLGRYLQVFANIDIFGCTYIY